MTSYTSQPKEVDMPASAIYARISDFSKFEDLVAKLPEEVRSQLGEVKFTTDTIVIPHNMLGQITLRERPECIFLPVSPRRRVSMSSTCECTSSTSGSMAKSPFSMMA